jgi:hypothetical protein
VSRAVSSFTTPVNSVPSNVFGIHTRGISSADKEQAEERAQKVNTLFNAATLPFYWARFEPQRGSPSPRRSKTLPAGASTITWSQKDTPRCRWLLEMSNAEILQAQIARIKNTPISGCF